MIYSRKGFEVFVARQVSRPVENVAYIILIHMRDAVVQVNLCACPPLGLHPKAASADFASHWTSYLRLLVFVYYLCLHVK